MRPRLPSWPAMTNHVPSSRSKKSFESAQRAAGIIDKMWITQLTSSRNATLPFRLLTICPPDACFAVEKTFGGDDHETPGLRLRRRSVRRPA